MYTSLYNKTKDEPLGALYKQLLSGSRTASAQMAAILVPRLFRAFKIKFGALVVREDIEDAVFEFILWLFQNPEKYDPAKSALFAFAKMMTHRRLVDLIRKKRSSGKDRLLSLDSVVEDAPHTNIRLWNDNSGERRRESEPEHVALMISVDTHEEWPPELTAYMKQILPEFRDRELLRLTFEQGNISEEVFSRLFGVERLPLEARRKLLKQNRDRVVAKAKRHRENIGRLICTNDE